MKVFSIKDEKSGLHMRPFFEKSSVDAIRGLEVAVNEGDSMLRKFPADFRLLCLGDYHESTGKFNLLDVPTDLGCAVDFVRSVVRSVDELPLQREA